MEGIITWNIVLVGFLTELCLNICQINVKNILLCPPPDSILKVAHPLTLKINLRQKVNLNIASNENE